MKFKKIGSNAEVSIKTSDYKINWDHQVSKPQKKVKDFLRPFWGHLNVLEEFRIPGSKFRIDLINLDDMVAIEVSPKQHFSYNAFLHKGEHSKFLNTIKHDCSKKKWCEHNGFTHVEITDDDLKNLSEELFKEKFGVDL